MFLVLHTLDRSGSILSMKLASQLSKISVNDVSIFVNGLILASNNLTLLSIIHYRQATAYLSLHGMF